MFGNLTRGIPAKRLPMFDSAAGDAAQKIGLDPIDSRAALAVMQGFRQSALAIALQVSDDISSNSLDDGELASERLDSYMLDVLGVDEGEEPDTNSLNLLSACVADAFETLGCSEDLVADIFNEDPATADSAIESAADTVIGSMPDDGDAMDSLVKGFIYGFSSPDMSDVEPDSDGDEAGFDAMGKPGKKLAAGKKTTKKVNGRTIVYQAKKVVRNGKVTVVNKRISGKLILSAAQRAGMKKLHAKPKSASSFKKAHRSIVKGVVAHIYHPKHAAGAMNMAKGGMKKFGS